MRITIALIGVALLSLLFNHAGDANNSDIPWLTYEEARKQGANQSKKYLLYFQTDRCRYCRQLEQQTLANRDVIDYVNSHYLPVRIDSSKNPRLAAQHGVRGVPALHFLSPEGEPIANWPGFIGAEQLLPLLRFIHTESYLKMSYKDFINQQ